MPIDYFCEVAHARAAALKEALRHEALEKT
jgi:hypothetical protein